MIEQGFEGIHYFSLCACATKEFWAIVQTNVELITENLRNIGTVSSKPLELQKSHSPTTVEEILKLKVFKDITQPIVSTTVQPLQFALT